MFITDFRSVFCILRISARFASNAPDVRSGDDLPSPAGPATLALANAPMRAGCRIRKEHALGLANPRGRHRFSVATNAKNAFARRSCSNKEMERDYDSNPR
jgi:hypothetical protein